MALTDRQRRFCQEYLTDLNGTQAATRAGYSAKTANEQAARLLANVSVRAEIERLQEERAARTGVTTDRVVQELAKVAFSDPRKMFRPDGTMKSPAEWDDETAAVIAGLETEEEVRTNASLQTQTVTRTKKLKRLDKLTALELLGKHLGMFKERVEVSGPGGGPIPIEEVVVRTRQEAAAVLAALPGPG